MVSSPYLTSIAALGTLKLSNLVRDCSRAKVCRLTYSRNFFG